MKRLLHPALLVLVAGFLLRLLFVFFISPPEEHLVTDMQGYWERAVALAQCQPETAMDTFHAPGTQYLYSLCFLLGHPWFFVKLLNVLMGTAMCLMTWLCARILVREWAAFFALCFCSFNYLFMAYAGLLLSETPFMLMMMIMLYFLLRSITEPADRKRRLHALLTGFFFVAAAAFRVTVLAFLPLLGLWWLLNLRKHRLVWHPLFLAIGFLPLFFAMNHRVQVLTGRSGVICTNGGINFFMGRTHVNKIEFTVPRTGEQYLFAHPVAVQKDYPGEASFQQAPYEPNLYYALGLAAIRQDPLQAAWFSLTNTWDLFVSTVPWPIGPCLSMFWADLFNWIAVILAAIPALLLPLLRWREVRGTLLVLPYLMLLGLLATAAVYAGEPRFRISYDGIIAILAGQAWWLAATWCRKRFFSDRG